MYLWASDGGFACHILSAGSLALPLHAQVGNVEGRCLADVVGAAAVAERPRRALEVLRVGRGACDYRPLDVVDVIQQLVQYLIYTLV